MASTGEAWRLGRRPALDGLRGLAILLVMLCHAVPTWFDAAGTVGVTLFFTLSGFLITTLLLEERERTGRTDLRRFYRARAVRLLPALVVVLAVCMAFLWYAGMDVRDVAAIGAPILLYVGNWTAMGYPTGGYAVLQHTWSLAVEEQFYLLWPFVLILVARGRPRFSLTPLAWAAAAVSLYAVVARVVLWDGGAGKIRVYFGTDTHADSILIGCLLAVLVRQAGRLPRFKAWVAPLAVAGLAGCTLAGTGFGRYIVAATLVPLLAVPLLCSAASDTPPRWLTWRPLRTTGRISYGMYLWNYPLTWVAPVMLAPVVGAVAAGGLVIVGTFVLAGLSWVLVEQPVTRLARRRLWRRDAEPLHRQARGGVQAAAG